MAPAVQEANHRVRRGDAGPKWNVRRTRVDAERRRYRNVATENRITRPHRERERERERERTTGLKWRKTPRARFGQWRSCAAVDSRCDADLSGVIIGGRDMARRYATTSGRPFRVFRRLAVSRLRHRCTTV